MERKLVGYADLIASVSGLMAEAIGVGFPEEISVRRSGPDFLCIGMSRSGTDWLRGHLRGHPDVWMPPIKEMTYFDDGRDFAPGERLTKKARLISEKLATSRANRQRRLADERDVAFLEKARVGRNGSDVYGYYRDLFVPKGDKISGDMTPSYAALPPHTIAGIATHLPELRAVLLIREPIERCWSQLCLKFRSERFEEAELADWAAVEEYIVQPHIVGRSFPSRIHARWSAALGDRFRHFFFDDIVGRPAEVRQEILSFVGADPDKDAGQAADFNRKAGSYKPKMMPEIRARLIDHFAEELAACAATFGGPAARWPARYGL